MVLSHGVQTRWSTQNQHEYEKRGEIVDLSVVEMSLFFMFEVFKSHILNWRADDAIVFKHSTASWCSWQCQSWTVESSGRSCKKEEERIKSSNERWWKWRMELVLMMEIRLLRMNCNMFQLLIPGSMISASSLSGSLANIIAPITEVTASISSSSRWRPNDVLTTAGYKEYKLLRPFPSPFDWTMENRSWRLTWRNSAAVVAQIKYH